MATHPDADDESPQRQEAGGDTDPPLAINTVLLTITDTHSRLNGGGVNVTAEHRGLTLGLTNSLEDLDIERARTGSSPNHSDDDVLQRAGTELAKSFLPPVLLARFEELLSVSRLRHKALHLGIEPGPFADLPWESIAQSATGTPLALQVGVNVYRHAVPRHSAGHTRDDTQPGPLQILAVFAAPELGDNAVLDSERELRNLLDRVEDARKHGAVVRTVYFGTTKNIRDALDQAPAHVLHLSGHGTPGALILETDDGESRRVSAETFVAEAFPQGRRPTVVSLAVCHSNAQPAGGTPSFAARLIEHGVPAVLATETSVTDSYASSLFTEFYGQLSTATHPDAVAILAAARRDVQRRIEAVPRSSDLRRAGSHEWAAVTLVASNPVVLVFDPDRHKVPEEVRQKPIGGLPPRNRGDLIERRSEIRTLLSELRRGDTAGLVLHALAGMGKSTLAGQIAERQHFYAPAVVVHTSITVDAILSALARTLRHTTDNAVSETTPRITNAIDRTSTITHPWPQRLKALQQLAFNRQPVLLILDHLEISETTLAPIDTQVAEMLAALVDYPRLCRLIVTCHYRFALPNEAHKRLHFHQLRPLSVAETRKLAWALPRIDLLDTTELERIWQLAGGHPRAWEYVDALLNDKDGRYPDITTRLARTLRQLDVLDSATHSTAAASATETAIAAVAHEAHFDGLRAHLSVEAGNLLAGASVYRPAVDINGLRFQFGATTPSDDDLAEQGKLDGCVGELVSLNLLNVVEPGYWSAHRWIATELAQVRHHPAGLVHLTFAHQNASRYWQWRAARTDGINGQLAALEEARYHLVEIGDDESTSTVTEWICALLHRFRDVDAWNREIALIVEELDRLDEDDTRRQPWAYQLGLVLTERGDLRSARDHFAKALKMAEDPSDPARAAACHNMIGVVAMQLGDYEDAERHLEASGKLSTDLKDPAGIVRALHNLGNLAERLGHYTKAKQIHSETMRIHTALGDQSAIANSYTQLASVANLARDYPEADRLYRAALLISFKLGDRKNIARTVHNLAAVAQRAGDLERAGLLARNALRALSLLDDLDGVATVQKLLGAIAEQLGDFDEAQRLYLSALKLHEAGDNRPYIAYDHLSLGELARARGEFEIAREHLTASLELLAEIRDAATFANACGFMGRLAEDQGRVDEAVHWLQRSVDTHKSIDNRLGAQIALSDLADLAENQGDLRAAFDFRIQILDPELHTGRPPLYDISKIINLRSQLQPSVFTQWVGEMIGTDNVDRFNEMMDSYAIGLARLDDRLD